MAKALEEMVFDEEEISKVNKAKPRRKKRVSYKVRSTRNELDLAEAETLALSAIKKLKDIEQELKDSIFERDNEIRDLFLALIANENVLLLGPPGTGKTMLAKAFTSHIEDANLFSWLMNKTTDPADIAGPYSVKQMENDRFVRLPRGRAPEAELAFFDEIFKANEPSLNYMLSMLNEKLFHNDGKEEEVNLRLGIGASNEYPETDSLEAFYDRFIFRHWVSYIQDPQNRIKMARAARESKVKAKSIIPKTTLSLEEVDALQSYVFHMKFTPQVEKTFDRLIRSLANKDIRISDRRYYKAQIAMMANAMLEGRDTVNLTDFTSLRNVLWNKDVREIAIVEEELGKFVNPHESKLKDLLKKAQQVQENTLKIENRTERAAEAVEANHSLQDILGKMEDEIDEARTNSVDINPLKKFLTNVEDIMNDIAEQCLKNTNRSQRKW